MAGDGSRFSKEGFKTPKPFLPVVTSLDSHNDMMRISPMYQVVIDNILNIFEVKNGFSVSEIIILKRTEHEIDFGTHKIMEKRFNVPFTIINVENKTEGALCTALLAENKINSDEDLLIINSDQLIEDDANSSIPLFPTADNIILTFTPNDDSNKWSFVKLNENGLVEKVVEKNKISDIATCGAYYFGSGKDFVQSAKKMIESNDRFNGEFYLAPVYNYLTHNRTICYHVNSMIGLGTPEDYQSYHMNRFQLEYDKEKGVFKW
jgi:dTDP-glucose pyrophosphorylase